MIRAVPACAIEFIKAHEGLRLTAYQDSADIVTVGWGHVAFGLKVGAKIPQTLAELYLAGDLDMAAKRLYAVLHEPVLLDLTDNQYAALVSFVFNLGCKPEWTIWKLLNARDYDHVPEQMMRFVYAGGKKVQGLVNRRAAEVALWSTAEPGSVPDEPSSASTRLAPTPPLPAKPTGIKGHVIACISVVGAACTQYAKPIKDAADQLTAFSGSHIMAHVTEGLLTIAGIATLAGLVAALLKNRQAHT